MKKISVAFSSCLLVLSATTVAFKPSKIIVFGDSLSDTGYQNSLPFVAKIAGIPWPKGKKTTYTSTEYGVGDIKETGKVWSNYLSSYFNEKYHTQNYNNLSETNNKNKPIDPENIYQNIGVSGDSNGTNYAAGGATTTGIGIQIKAPFHGRDIILYSPPSLKDQVCQYLDGKKDDNNHFILDAQGNCQPQEKADPNAQYIIWAGANDLLKFVSNVNKSGQILAPNGGVIQSDQQFKYFGGSIVRSSIINIANEIKLLKHQGAKHIIFINLPDISLTPLVPILLQTNPQLPQLKEDFYIAVYSFSALANSYISNAGEGIDLKMLRTDLLLGKIISNKQIFIYGQRFIFDNVKNSACTPTNDVWSKTAITCNPIIDADGAVKNPLPLGYVFEDSVHPTSRVHAVLAAAIEQCINTGICPR
mgnify:CR=1 FL=1